MELSNFIITHIIMGAFWSVVIFLVWLWGHRHCRALKARNVDLEQQLADLTGKMGMVDAAAWLVNNRAESTARKLAEAEKKLADHEDSEELARARDVLRRLLYFRESIQAKAFDRHSECLDELFAQAGAALGKQAPLDDPNQGVIPGMVEFAADIEKVPEGEENLPQSTQSTQRRE